MALPGTTALPRRPHSSARRSVGWYTRLAPRMLPSVIGGPGGCVCSAMMSAACIDDHRERDLRIEIGIKMTQTRLVVVQAR